MCTEGQCPIMMFYNICTFEENRSDEFNKSPVYIPYSFQTEDSNASCLTLGNNEWAPSTEPSDEARVAICPGYVETGYTTGETDAAPVIQNCINTSAPSGYAISCVTKGGYQGENIACCLQNMFCSVDTASSKIQTIRDENRYNPLCFDTNLLSGSSGICDPKFRRLGGNDCYQAMFNWCTTDTVEGTMANKWAGSVTLNSSFLAIKPCFKLFFSTFYSDAYGPTPMDTSDSLIGHECYTPQLDYLTSDSIVVPNPTNFEGPRRAQALLTTMLTNYTEKGGILAGSSENPNVNMSFNQLIYQLCDKYPGVCSNFLQNYCLPVTENDIKRNLKLLNLCGCNLSTSVNSLFVDTFQITEECTPYCNVPGVIPKPISFLERGGRKCQQSTCVINDITLNFIDSEVGGQGLTLGNFCSSCGGTGQVCTCLLSDITFTSISSQISGLNLSQQCGSGKCVIPQVQKSGETQHVSIPCNVTRGSILPNSIELKKAGEFIITALIILFVFIVLIALFFLAWKILGIYTDPGIAPLVKLEPDLSYAPARRYTSILDRKLTLRDLSE